MLRSGRVERTFKKTLLPTYDVFDEDRYFEPAAEPQILELGTAVLGISICEDIWNDRDFWKRRRYHTDPVQELVAAGAQAVINLSASPFTAGKQKHREAMLADLAKKYRIPFFYVNQVGGNDDLVFDGRSCVFDKEGRLVARARGFEEDLIIADPGRREGSDRRGRFHSRVRDLAGSGFGHARLRAQVRLFRGSAGPFRGHRLEPGGGHSRFRPWARRTSWGCSCLPLTPAGPALRMRCALAQNLGLKTITMSITDIMKSFDRELAKPFQGQPKDVTEENIQARIRGNLLMALSNKFGLVLLTTGNKSELAVGYCTIYGDMSGGLAVISDVPKTAVYRLAKWLNARGSEIIPTAVLHKAPTAELRFGQTDQDSLPPYEVLDDILERYIELHQSKEELLAEGFEKAMVERVLCLVKSAEFKRRQAAPGLKVTDRAFGSGWRMPVASRAW